MKMTPKLIVALFLGASVHLAWAQAADDGLVSFGRRAPKPEEISQALGLTPDGQPTESGLRAKGVSMGSASTRAGARLKAMDMDVQFAFGSDSLAAGSKSQLAPLGDFMKSAKLGNNVLVIEGHTDGLGSGDFANDLSVRRAQAVRDYLVSEHRVDPNTLVVVGRGKQMLKDASNPASEANRRIQFYVKPRD